MRAAVLAAMGKHEDPQAAVEAFCGTYKDCNCMSGIFSPRAEPEFSVAAAHT